MLYHVFVFLLQNVTLCSNAETVSTLVHFLLNSLRNCCNADRMCSNTASFLCAPKRNSNTSTMYLSHCCDRWRMKTAKRRCIIYWNDIVWMDDRFYSNFSKATHKNCGENMFVQRTKLNLFSFGFYYKA